MIEYPELIFEQLSVGSMANFQYFIGDKNKGEIALVDPAWDAAYYINEAKKNGWNITCLLLTHGHYDHADAVEEMSEELNVPVYISSAESEMYIPSCKDLRKTMDHEKILIGKIEIECIQTPGHSTGCQCFKYKDILITGDTLFVNGCGRCDLPGGNPKTMANTLYDIILKLPDTTVIYPGHEYGPSSFATLQEQKKTNPYLTCKNKDEFLRKRMGL